MKEQIIARAKKIYQLSSEILVEREDEIQSETYKFCYLLLRGPKQFKYAFDVGDLRLDESKIHDGYWEWRFDIPGPKGLTDEEVRLIEFHNQQVQMLEKLSSF